MQPASYRRLIGAAALHTPVLGPHDALGIDLGFQDFEQEMAGFPGAYAPPGGRLLLALDGSEAAGSACAALAWLT